MTNGPWVLITGASFGIGEAMAHSFAKRGMNLVLVARNQEKLEKLCKELELKSKVSCLFFSDDLTSPGACERLWDFTQSKNINLTYLVNNAGFGAFGAFHQQSVSLLSNMIELNIAALTKLTRLYLPSLLSQRKGGVLNVASVAAFQPGPLMAVYYASKAFVLSFSEALREELLGTGVHVSVLCPGPTSTEFQKRASMDQSKLFKRGLTQAVEPVAELGVEAFLKRKAVIIPGWANKLLSQGHRVAPRWLLPKVVKKIQEKSN